jgi:nucleotide-binding universal stress UspA family protein
MTVRPSILCPVDYSEASVGALRYAAALAEHFATRLLVLTVEDQLLTTALELQTGVKWTPATSERELADFASNALGDGAATSARREFRAEVGKPPVEILRVARAEACDLIVMGSRGQTGVRKLFLGSTAERVLRETTIPVLVTPPTDPGPVRLEDAPRLLGRIVAPVDLSPNSTYQAHVAGAVAGALGLPLLLVHVLEPVQTRVLERFRLTGLDAERRSTAELALSQIVATSVSGLPSEVLVLSGDPAEEIAKVLRERRAGLLVMGLHESSFLGPRMGSVTYRTLALSSVLVLALPPQAAGAGT